MFVVDNLKEKSAIFVLQLISNYSQLLRKRRID